MAPVKVHTAPASWTRDPVKAAAEEEDMSSSFVERILATEKPLPPVRWSNVLNEIQWISFLALTIPPVLAVYAIFTVPLQSKTLAWSIIYYFMTGIGVTAGYHRLWAHCAYTASRPLAIALMCMGSGSVEGSALWWARGHRSHHRYTDTDLDPYGAHTGLLWAHVGWMVIKPRRRPGPVDTSDLRRDPVVAFQHKHYLALMLFFGFIFPTLVAGLGWGDYKGGFFFAAICRLVFVHHSTFCINSLAHYLGEASYDRKHSPRDNWITALATVGEGYHNFHHEFPMDYRNAVIWYQYDPTKWFIWFMGKLGLATNLKQFPDNEVRKGRLAMQLAEAHDAARELEWSKSANHLPVMTWDDFTAESKERALVVVHGFIHDVTDFLDKHPSGRALLLSRIGKDATTAFEGGVYEHSNAAHNMLSMMRVGVLSGGYRLAKDDLARSDSATRQEEQAVDAALPQVKPDGSEKRVAKDATEYVVPGEAYKIVERASLGENVRVQGTRYGKLL